MTRSVQCVCLLHSLSRGQKQNPRLFAQPKILAQMGRFSLLASAVERGNREEAEELLQRYGVVSREMARAEGRVWADMFAIYQARRKAPSFRYGDISRTLV